MKERREGEPPAVFWSHRLAVGQEAFADRRGRVRIKIAPEAVEILGAHGRLISESKTAYKDAHPGHHVLFNACVFDEGGTVIWFGDLDFTLDGERLQQLADRLWRTIHVTPESYRREGLPTGTEDCYEPLIWDYRPRRRGRAGRKRAT